jgi:hypothetical protein
MLVVGKDEFIRFFTNNQPLTTNNFLKLLHAYG